MDSHDLDVVVTRGNAVESYHRVHAAVVSAGDSLLGQAGDARMVTFWRSCAKPFQIMPLVESGGFEAFGWGEEELALSCASHGGEPEHVAIVEAMLGKLGLEEGDLACGPQDPLSPRGSKIARESGIRIKRTHNNCSGKHTAMLGYAHHRGWPIKGYEQIDHPVQQAMLNQVALWSDVPPSAIEVAVDGCGAAVFGLPLDKMARAYARLGCAARRGEEIPARIVAAMASNPFLVGGTDRFDSVLIEETEGRVLSKVGAEGVHCAVILDSAIGIAVKVEDGSPRAQYPALLRLLQNLDALPDPLPARLMEIMRRPVRNSRGDIVGETFPRAGTARPVMPVEVAGI
ncbi:MAG TPA: asparaginase [Gemmatimonadaceae bacterium]|nr:asparaginase [Gemmatimonadaceae bacterium]